jgi:hypothetical protein
MRIKQIVENSTTSGSISTVAMPLMKQTRESVDVPGLKPVSQVMARKAKKKGPYANSLVEGKVKDLMMDLSAGKDGLSDEEFKKKYGKTKEEMRNAMRQNKSQPVAEATLEEDDIILNPRTGRLRKSGFLPHSREPEGETFKNSLHTIVRVASHLDKELSTQDEFPEWMSEKIGAVKGMMVSIMNYVISSQEMQHDNDAMNEGARVDSLVTDALKIMRGSDVTDAVLALKTVLGNREYDERPGHYNFYIRQMLDMYNKQGVAEGSSGAKYKIKSVGVKNGKDFYISPNTGKEVYKKAKVGDHETPNGEIKPAVRMPYKEGKKVDKFVNDVKKSEVKAGHGKKEAENIAWATANKRGMLDNKNKKA